MQQLVEENHSANATIDNLNKEIISLREQLVNVQDNLLNYD